MKTARHQVYAAIDTERNYQDTLFRKGVRTDMSKGKVSTPMEQLAIISRIVRDAENHWYENAGALPLDFMRKIAATAVRTMEDHGAPARYMPGVQATANNPHPAPPGVPAAFFRKQPKGRFTTPVQKPPRVKTPFTKKAKAKKKR